MIFPRFSAKLNPHTRPGGRPRSAGPLVLHRKKISVKRGFINVVT
jgi:hypothetical protein